MKLVFLDAEPLGTLANPNATAENEACRDWLRRLVDAGHAVFYPEIADYEVRRELLRIGRMASVRRLDQFRHSPGLTVATVTTNVWLTAAKLWAEARRHGRPTADPHALDADVLLAATLRVYGPNSDEAIVATANVRHWARFVPAARWQDIAP